VAELLNRRTFRPSAQRKIPMPADREKKLKRGLNGRDKLFAGQPTRGLPRLREPGPKFPSASKGRRVEPGAGTRLVGGHVQGKQVFAFPLTKTDHG